VRQSRMQSHPRGVLPMTSCLINQIACAVGGFLIGWWASAGWYLRRRP
jgi:hypothetical protein